VVVPPLLRLSFHQTDPAFVPVLAMLHLGTAAALLILYWREWWSIARGFVRAVWRGQVSEPDERLALLLLVGTLPAGIIGFIFQSTLKSNFTDARLAAALLIVNGAILLAAEWYRRRDERRQDVADAGAARHEAGDSGYARVEGLGLRSAILVGACQVAALFPGISRSGVTIAAGLVAGLRHQEAARFSFLLATPIILAAGVLEVPDLGPNRPTALVAAGAAALAGAVAYVCARFLLRYLRSGRLDPFAYYCAALGITSLLLVR
jgi:undecaprenyl-diphosphatase